MWEHCLSPPQDGEAKIIGPGYSIDADLSRVEKEGSKTYYTGDHGKRFEVRMFFR
jgi:hypothetical protein